MVSGHRGAGRPTRREPLGGVEPRLQEGGFSKDVCGEFQSLKIIARADEAPAGSKRGLRCFSGRGGSWSQGPWLGATLERRGQGVSSVREGGQQRLGTAQASHGRTETGGLPVFLSHGHQGSSPLDPTPIFRLF